MINEVLKLNLIKAQDTRQAKEKRAQELISQVHALSSWAVKNNKKHRLFDEAAGQKSRESSNEKEMLSDVNLTSESDDEDSVERNGVLINAQEALKKSMVVGKELNQAKYKNPMRQHAKIVKNRQNLHLA